VSTHAAGTGPEVRAEGNGGLAEGYLHEMGVYASDREFQELICPFALDGLEAGEPVVFAYDPYKAGLLQGWLPDSSGFTYITDASPYATPAKALAGWRRVVTDHLAAGAKRVRIAGNVPHPGYGRPYAGWDRYEAATDCALGDLPVWAPCLYDARVAPVEVLQAAERLHHHLLDLDGTHRINGSFRPAGRLADFIRPLPDPLERTAPASELLDPMPHRLRSAISQAAEGLISGHQAHDLLLAASEAVTNARVHGAPPVIARIWTGEGRIVVQVRDSGTGPADPFTGFFPREQQEESGRGLWLVHQLDVDAALIPAEEGFTVRLRAGKEPAAFPASIGTARR
jgi:anti-sigma regulatory factor (Ser/Thr protein kinase)